MEVVRLGLGKRGSEAVPDDVAATALTQAGDECMDKMEGMTAKQKAEIMALHKDIIA